MKILFLDIDGVCNTRDHIRRDGMHAIGEEFLDRLKKIVDATGVQIVLSSTWRIAETNRRMVEKALAIKDMKLLDCTIEIERGFEWVPRAEEIQEWISRNGVEKFAILDDNSDAGETEMLFGSFFQTTFEEGLTEEITERVIKHFG